MKPSSTRATGRVPVVCANPKISIIYHISYIYIIYPMVPARGPKSLFYLHFMVTLRLGSCRQSRLCNLGDAITCSITSPIHPFSHQSSNQPWGHPSSHSSINPSIHHPSMHPSMHPFIHPYQGCKLAHIKWHALMKLRRAEQRINKVRKVRLSSSSTSSSSLSWSSTSLPQWGNARVSSKCSLSSSTSSSVGHGAARCGWGFEPWRCLGILWCMYVCIERCLWIPWRCLGM